jgi:hypothetical protein
MFQIKAIDKIQKRIVYSIIFSFRKSCLLWDKVEKCCRAGKGTYGKMAHAHCMLTTSDYKYTIRIWIIYWFYTAKLVAQTRLNVRLYVYCLYCLNLEIDFVHPLIYDFKNALLRTQVVVMIWWHMFVKGWFSIPVLFKIKQIGFL